MPLLAISNPLSYSCGSRHAGHLSINFLTVFYNCARYDLYLLSHLLSIDNPFNRVLISLCFLQTPATRVPTSPRIEVMPTFNQTHSIHRTMTLYRVTRLRRIPWKASGVLTCLLHYADVGTGSFKCFYHQQIHAAGAPGMGVLL